MSYYQAAVDITSNGGHKSRLQWMDANDIASMSTSPAGEVRIIYRDGRQIDGAADLLLPVHLRKGP
jgi:hypothetical protein